MSSICCVFGCSSGRSVPSHLFPKAPVYFNAWKTAVMSEKIANLSDAQLSKRVVCHKHFMECDYVPNLSRRKLRRDVIPSLHIQNYSGNVENIIVGEIGQERQLEVPLTSQPCSNTAGQVGQERQLEVPLSPQPCSSTVVQVGQEYENVTPPTVKRRRVFMLSAGVQQNQLRPQNQKLYATAKYFHRRKVRIAKPLSNTKIRLRDTAKYYYSESTQGLLAKLTPVQRTFIVMQLRSAKNKQKVCAELIYHFIRERAFAIALSKE